MTTMMPIKLVRLNFRRLFPSFVLAISALVIWLLGPDKLPILPWLCLLSALETARYIVFEAKFPSLFTWFATSYIGLFLVYPVMAPLLGVEISTSDKVFVSYCFLAVGGIHLFIIAYEQAANRFTERNWNVYYQTTSRRLFRIVCFLLILNIFAMLLVVADAGSFSSIGLRTRDEMKVSLGVLGQAGYYLFIIGSLLYPLLAAYVRSRRLLAILWLPVIVGIEIFLFLAFRARTPLMAHTVGLLVGWFLIAPRMLIDNNQTDLRLHMGMSILKKILLIVLIVSLVMGMFVLRIVRGEFEQTSSLGEIDINMAASILFAFEGSGELGYSKLVFKILEVVPGRHDYMYGQSYYRLLFVPIPRSLWPEKPHNSQIIYAQWIDPGAVSWQSTPVGIIGDLYANFGMWGILGMLIFGYTFGCHDRNRKLTHALFLAVSFAMVFHIARGAFTNPLIEMAVSFVMARLAANYLYRGGLRSRSYAFSHSSSITYALHSDTAIVVGRGAMDSYSK